MLFQENLTNIFSKMSLQKDLTVLIHFKINFITNTK